MYRYYLLLTYLFFNFSSSAQGLKGTIKDLYTGQFLDGVSVKTNNRTTYSDSRGGFSLYNSAFGDTITFSYVGYEQQAFVHHRIKGDSITIMLKPSSFDIEEVVVQGLRNFKADSLRFREEYADAFGYKKTRFKDIFIPKDYHSNQNRSPFAAPNSTSSLISVDVLSLISLIRKEKAPQAKLQKKVLKQEEQNYVDYAFSKQKIQEITKLSGDSLQLFIQSYRPGVEELKNMSTYDLLYYIKEKFKEFKE
ncbi:MAG: carboxypeptidase-like regulatory domain-containing protein [Sphingobacterium sp.]